jgi:hypothetical protein
MAADHAAEAAIDLTGLSDEEAPPPPAAAAAAQEVEVAVAPSAARERPKRRRPGTTIEDHLARFSREVNEAEGQSGEYMTELRDRQDAELAALQSDERDALLVRQQRERGTLLALHATLQAAREEARPAARLDASICAGCGSRVDLEDEDDSWFVCGFCGSTFCSTCTQEESCRVCQTSYCEDCAGHLDNCLGCITEGGLTCCGLEQLPCGAFECESCIDNHGDHCRLCVRRAV